MNKSFTKVINLLRCQKCNASLNQLGDVEFIVRCKKCYWVSKFRFGTLQKGEIKKTSNLVGLFRKLVEGGVLYSYPFDMRSIIDFVSISKLTAIALEKFILSNERLSFSEKNLLYKLKAQSISKVEAKIGYLEAKKKSIEILRFLEF